MAIFFAWSESVTQWRNFTFDSPTPARESLFSISFSSISLVMSGQPSWQHRHAADVPVTASQAIKSKWVGEHLSTSFRAQDCWRELQRRTVSIASWLFLLHPSQRLPPVEERPFVVMTLVVDFFLCFLIIREGPRVTRQKSPLQLLDVSFGTARATGREKLSLDEFRRLSATRNPVVEADGRVTDTTLLGTCQKCNYTIHCRCLTRSMPTSQWHMRTSGFTSGL